MTTELLRGGQGVDGRPLDLRLDGTTVAETGRLRRRRGEAVTELDGRVVLPAFAEPHVHLDKAFTLAQAINTTGDLHGAMSAYSSLADAMDPDDLCRRARRALRQLVAAGATVVRAQIGCGPRTGVRAIEILADLRAAVADAVELQVVAHAAVPTGGPTAHRALLRAALDAGADHLGGNAFLEGDPHSALRVCFEVAHERGCGLDLHVDESPTAHTLPDVVAGASTGDVPVVAAHCVSLASMPQRKARVLAEAAAEAGVGVVTLPLTNLYLQDRRSPTPRWRGLTAISTLRSAGVLVAAGTDNVQDPFAPVGRLDPLEIAALLVTAGHQDVPVAAQMVGADARRVVGAPEAGPFPGARADLVAIAAEDVTDVVARAPMDRLVWHGGRLVARTGVSGEVAF